MKLLGNSLSVQRSVIVGKLASVGVIVIIVVAGVYFLTHSHAATPIIAVEPEAGTLDSCTSKVTDAVASGGSAIKFGCPSGTDALGLDETGNTIPDTNYTIPAGAIYLATNGNDANAGTLAAPFKTISKAINSVPNGGTIVVRAGTYRDGYASGTTYGIANKTLAIQAYPHEQVWFNGTDVQDPASWTSDGAGHWYKAWNTPSFCQNSYYTYKYDAQPTAGPCSHSDMYADPTNPAAGDPQMAFIDGNYVHEVTTLAAATPGNFFYDWAARRIFIATTPTGHTVELAARPTFLVMGGTATVNVKIRGLGFKRYATNEVGNQTTGAVTIYGTGTVIENNVFKQMAAQAITASPKGSVYNRNVLVDNGYNGAGSNGSYTSGATIVDNLQITNNYVGRNNTEKFGTNCVASCGQGGIKISHMNGFTAKNNIFDSNYGHGFWCDLACSKGIMVNNVAKNNNRSGIIYEASDTGIIASNLVMNNGFTGLRIAAANTKVYNNTLINNGNYADLWLYDDPRSYGYTTPGSTHVWTDVGPDTVNVEVVNNVFYSYNILTRYQGDTTLNTNTGPEEFFTKLDYNAFFRTGGTAQIVERWMNPATTDYKSTASFAAAHNGYDSHSLDIASGTDPFFTNFAGGDYNVRSTSPAYHTGTTLPADVAAAIGVLTTGQSRGAIIWPGQ